MTEPLSNKTAQLTHNDNELLSSNFLRQIIETELTQGVYASRRWGGSPGDAVHHARGEVDVAKIRTRFPPEPNGYLHIGHAKSIFLNFGLAQDYQGACHLRFDDTNPEKENEEFAKSIMEAVHWLGFDWQDNLYHASDYFPFMYEAARQMIQHGDAYVDEQDAEQIRIYRGDFTTPGVDSPYRSRNVDENLKRFEEMREGKHPDGTMIVRAKIDMKSPNINLRDPAIYRIRHAHHHRTGNAWCVYPMYTFAHPIEDALEQITHSICTLEFEDQRPFYDWLLEKLASYGLLAKPLPKQHEFARLNLTYVVTSKRKLAQLVAEKHVNGWNDPRMPTLVGLRRRGYTPQTLQLFTKRIGVSKSDGWIDYSVLEGSLRDTLDEQAPRAMVVLNPIKLILTNWEEVMGSADYQEPCQAPIHPHHLERGMHHFYLAKEIWIERTDYEDIPPKGYNRLYPPQKQTDGNWGLGSKVRLKYGYVVECEGVDRNEAGSIISVRAKLIANTKSGTAGANSVKVKGVITWVACQQAFPVKVNLFERLFLDAQPDAGGRDFISALNPNSLQTIEAFAQSYLKQALPEEHYQFERHGYFCVDSVLSKPNAPVFNLSVTLKEGWVAKTN